MITQFAHWWIWNPNLKRTVVKDRDLIINNLASQACWMFKSVDLQIIPTLEVSLLILWPLQSKQSVLVWKHIKGRILLLIRGSRNWYRSELDGYIYELVALTSWSRIQIIMPTLFKVHTMLLFKDMLLYSQLLLLEQAFLLEKGIDDA